MERHKSSFRTYIAVFGLVIAAIGLTQSIFELRNKKDLLTERQLTLERLTQENSKLQSRLKEAQMPEFVEREARNRLGMGKPGETVILMDQGSGRNRENSQTTLPEAEPVWKQWWSVFF